MLDSAAILTLALVTVALVGLGASVDRARERNGNK